MEEWDDGDGQRAGVATHAETGDTEMTTIEIMALAQQLMGAIREDMATQGIALSSITVTDDGITATDTSGDTRYRLPE
jgi:hypothetical protein